MTSLLGDGPEWDEDRWLRAIISTVCPADAQVAPLVQQLGAAAAWEHIQTSRPGVTAVVESVPWLANRSATAQKMVNLPEPCGVLTPQDALWPAGLTDLPAPPVALWWRGHGDVTALLSRAVAVVGARAATGYGTRIAATMSADLATTGWTVVSGGAFGIDAAAHRGALTAGAVVCVLACGVDIAYPVAHHDLLQRIAVDGLILSETGLGQPARRYHFLARNRIIAAITRGTVVVEAALRSGSLSTARHALDLGRHVMAVPGPVSSTASAGVHELLRTCPDVHLVTDAQHVRELCGDIGDDACEVPDGPVGPIDTLSVTAARTLDHVGAKPVSATDVGQQTQLPLPQALAALAELQVAGLVTATPAGWVLTTRGRAPSPR